MKNYYSLHTDPDLLDIYEVKPLDDDDCLFRKDIRDSEVCPVVMDVVYLRRGRDKNYKLVYNLTTDYFAFFEDDNQEALKAFIQNTSHFTLNYQVKIDYSQKYDFDYPCNLWSIRQVFSYEDRNIIKMRMDLSTRMCDEFVSPENRPFVTIVTAITFVLAGISVVLTIKYFVNIAKVYQSIQMTYIQKQEEFRTQAQQHTLSINKIKKKNKMYIRQLSNQFKSYAQYDELTRDQVNQMKQSTTRRIRWKDLSFSDKAKLFNGWSLVILMSNFFQIFGAVLFVGRNLVPASNYQCFVGFGASLAWISISKYIEYTQRYSSFTRTISHAAPSIFKHLINMLPFWIGFAMLGMCVFWSGFRFKDPHIAFFSLFCTMFGDEISNTFTEVMQINYLFGMVYMCMFLIFSISFLLPLFLIFVKDSFELTQETHKYKWLQDDHVKDSSCSEDDSSGREISSKKKKTAAEKSKIVWV